ncbi:signal peptidase I [Moraxella marmotae]|uniref:signal peptidase I n=1 Tax=Moraxella marmotae TaxID=3344520 RepID=UPI0035F436CA
MNFDINLIIIPITLLFLVVWLVDKFALKQHRAIKHYAKQARAAESQLAADKAVLEKALSAHQITTPADAFAPNDETPSNIKAAHQDFLASRSRLVALKGNPPKQTALVRYSYEFLPVLAVIVLLRAFVVEPFNIPSSSMVPTLYTGDFIAVNKSAYGLRLPLIHTKILDTGSPERGDVAVFRYPLNDNVYFIKRIIGLPGDTVSFDKGVLSINGEAVPTSPTTYQMAKPLVEKMLPAVIDGQALSDADRAAMGREEERFAHYQSENLGKHTYTTRYVGEINASAAAPFLQQNSPLLLESGGEKWSITVPQGQYFVMGDNRDRSDDGRFWGFVPEANLSGKATYIWMHKEPGLHLPSFERNGAID